MTQDRKMIAIQMACTVLVHDIPPGLPLTERLAWAMERVHTHARDLFFMTGADDDLRFRTAVAAVLINANEDEKATITRSMAVINAMSAIFSGVPVDVEQIDTVNTVPLMQIFHTATLKVAADNRHTGKLF